MRTFESGAIAQITASAKNIGVEYAALAAVVWVESNGKTGESINGKFLPLIRWEGHYFYRRLSGDALRRARAEGLASPSAGAVKNPRPQARRWALFKRAYDIDQEAAIESMSYGVGQVMGGNWRSLGYKSAQDFFNDVTSGVDGQIRAMVRFIKTNHLVSKLKNHDWSGFARVYNGPKYRRYKYATKMRKQYLTFSNGKAPKRLTSNVLRSGAVGKRVRELQKLLIRNGYSLAVDGDFGVSTERAVREFQAREKLTVDGAAGPKTFQYLSHALQDTAEDLGHLPIIDVAEVKQGGGAAISAAMLQTTGQQIKDATYEVSAAGSSPIIDYVVTGMTVAATILLTAGVLYAAYGWLKSKRTLTE